jgi:acyl phosphate:glycerol-3-phosphate acyltransferase
VAEGLLIAAGYLLGSLPWGYWLPRWLRGVDIRTVGSGNVGASNVWRTFGVRLGLAVASLDILKGLAAALLGRLVDDELTGVLAGTAALAGHWRPVFLGFARGGKVVATTGGVGLAVAPLASLCAAGVWIVVFLAFRYPSVSSLAAGAALPLLAVAFGASWPVLAFTIGAAVAIAVLHRGNVRRLLRGEERRAGFSVAAALRRRAQAPF